MKLELNLLELNELYLATSRLVEQNQKHLDELGKNVSSINYFKTQLDSSKVLRDKIQTALYAEAKVLDEARDWVLKYKADSNAPMGSAAYKAYEAMYDSDVKAHS